MTNTYQVGIDGGGSGSRFSLFCLENHKVNTFNGPPLQLSESSPETIFSGICKTLDNHFHEQLFRLSKITMGIAGAHSSQKSKIIRSELEQLYHCETMLISDAEAAFFGAFGNTTDGLLLINGTGSVILTSMPGDTLKMYGGYGPYSREILSGRSIGLLALLYISQCTDTGATIPISLLNEVPVKSRHDLQNYIKQNNQSFAGLAMPLLNEAQSNDVVQTILEGEFYTFKQWLLTIKSSLNIPQSAAMHGGLYNNPWFKTKVTQILNDVFPDIKNISRLTGVSEILAKTPAGSLFRKIR